MEPGWCSKWCSWWIRWWCWLHKDPGGGGSGSGSAGWRRSRPPSSPPQEMMEDQHKVVAVVVPVVLVLMVQTVDGGAGSPIAIETNTAKTYAAGGFGGHQTPANNGTANTGDGGDADFNNAGFGGGSGIVVVRYKIASLDGTAKATGGSISFTGTKTVHTFTSSGTFHNPTALTIDYLIIGGGGAGGSNNGGGGGAGGVVAATGQPLPASPSASNSW